MSRSWYKPKAIPQLLESFSSSTLKRPRRQVQVWNTPCAVTRAGKSSLLQCTVLINPANPQLSGVSKFPYFPVGGPEPKEYPKKDSHHIMGYVTQWGGMEVGTGMVFASNVVDGLVHQLGGWKLQWECKFVPTVKDDNEEDNCRCPVGQAVVTGPGGSQLREHFDSIVHTVPPFYNHTTNPHDKLRQSYHSALHLALQHGNRVACPLLGAGARGFPLDVAMAIASQASMEWCQDEIDDSNGDLDSKEEQTLAFAIPDMEIAQQLVEELRGVETTTDLSA